MNLEASDAVGATGMIAHQSNDISLAQGSSYMSSPVGARRAAENTKGYRDVILGPLCPQKCTTSAKDDLRWPASPSYAKANMI